MKVLSFGEILWDIYPDKKYIGGAPLNFSAHLAKHGEEVYMFSAVGQDDLGREAKIQLEKWGVSTKYVSNLNNKQTGKCLVTLDDKCIPAYNLLQDVAYDDITCKEISDDFDILYFGTLALRSDCNYNSLNTLIRNNQFEEIFVDVNIRPPFYSKETVKFSIENATILKISVEELHTVSGLLGISKLLDYKVFANKLSSLYKNLKYIIITLGDEGAYAFDCINNTEYSCRCTEIEVKSTVGAGDSFSAAFLYKYLHKADINSCLEYAVKIAGYVVSEYEAVPNYNINDFI